MHQKRRSVVRFLVVLASAMVLAGLFSPAAGASGSGAGWVTFPFVNGLKLNQYVIRPTVTASASSSLMARVSETATDLNSVFAGTAKPATFSVGSAVADAATPGAGEIIVSIATSGTCGTGPGALAWGSWAGCGIPSVDQQQMVTAGSAQIANFALGYTDSQLRNIVKHEVGHTLGLDHPTTTGQVMTNDSAHTVQTYQAGDRAGLAFLADQGYRGAPTGNLDGTVTAVNRNTYKIRGWAADPDTTAAINVALTIDGSPPVTFAANVTRADVGAHGFEATWPLGISGGWHNVCATAVNAGPGFDQPIGCKALFFGLPGGAIDSAPIPKNPGVYTVKGWSFDPSYSYPTGTQLPAYVQLFVDAAPTPTTTTQANILRPDVCQVISCNGSMNLGWSVDLPLSTGPHDVCVAALDVESTGANGSTSLGCVHVDGLPIGALESTSFYGPNETYLVKGWALDPTNATPPTVQLFLDTTPGKGAPLTTVTPSNAHPITATYPGFTTPGFSVQITGLGVGSHTLCAYALDVETNGVAGSTALGCNSFSVAGTPLGNFEALTQAPGTGSTGSVRLTGWALDPDSSSPVQVRVSVDGVDKLTQTTSAARSDILGQYPGYQAYSTTPGYLLTVGAITYGPHTVCVTALNVGPGSNADPSCKLIDVGKAGLFRAVTPTRLLDSRDATSAWGVHPLGPGESKGLAVAGVGAVPATATAVVVNVTVTQGTVTPSYLSVTTDATPTGQQPSTANITFAAGQTTSTATTVRVGADGKINLFNQQGSVDVVVDLLGYYDDASSASSAGASKYTAITPQRILDSRNQTSPWAGQPLSGTNDLQVASTAAVPASATAVVMNVTVTGGSAASVLNVYPTGARPAVPTANVLFAGGQTVANLVTVGVGTGYKVTFENQTGSVHVVADVVGYYSATGAFFYAQRPARVIDSRSALGLPAALTGSRDVQVRATGGVPGSATAVAMTVTVTQGTQGSYLEVYPRGSQPSPDTANISFGPGQTIANFVVMGVGSNNSWTAYNQLGSVHVIGDSAGFFNP